ncbi:MAG: tRNA (adenosine(37)-N6)-dimethylallyltransferase MiaA [Acaryochloridaceae cyanobacterium RL_2_7]|nr:tRNA (adenosine(37)-N6)-dimethylallyltransferase MiaA [Acaryochloridaceae cyanobacterium RL_2_7]
MSPGLIVICGPTATGKSGFAQRLAEQYSLPILNADSRQIYRDFSIGTAKPTLSDRRAADHYLVDEVDPKIAFTVAEYQAKAQALISHFHNQGIIPILAGGTGLYIKSITRGLIIPRVAPQAELRSQLESWSQSILHQWLQIVDPISATKVHANDQVRTLRALEVFYVTGQPLSAQQGEAPPSYPILSIGLDIPDLEQHTHLIRERVEQMIDNGWLHEVQDIESRYGSDLPLLKTLGYAELQEHLRGKVTLQQAQESTVIHTRQFAKRQRTWFKAQPDITWIDAIQRDAWDRFRHITDDFLKQADTPMIHAPKIEAISS